MRLDKKRSLVQEQINTIKENAMNNVSENDTWENETVVNLIDTIETLQQENEQLKADIRGKDNEINNLKAIIAYLKKFEPRRNEAVREGSV